MSKTKEWYTEHCEKLEKLSREQMHAEQTLIAAVKFLVDKYPDDSRFDDLRSRLDDIASAIAAVRACLKENEHG